MILPGYEIQQELGGGWQHRLDRCRRLRDGRGSLPKTPSPVRLEAAEAQLRGQLAIRRRRLDLTAIFRACELVLSGDHAALLPEDGSGSSRRQTSDPPSRGSTTSRPARTLRASGPPGRRRPHK